MKTIKDEFIRSTNIKPLFICKLNKGITNKNYIVYTFKGIYILRMPRNNMIGMDYTNQQIVLEKANDLNVEVVAYDSNTGIQITKYLNGKKNKVNTSNIVSLLKELHAKNIENIKPFNPFKQIEIYKKEVKETLFDNELEILEKAKELYNKYSLVLCHNDVITDNFINNKNKNYLIDYEYAGLNIELFDVASYLSENELNEAQKEEFIKLYFNDVNKDILSDINTMIKMEDILWSYWAKAMYNISGEKVFIEIANTKIDRIKNN